VLMSRRGKELYNLVVSAIRLEEKQTHPVASISRTNGRSPVHCSEVSPGNQIRCRAGADWLFLRRIQKYLQLPAGSITSIFVAMLVLSCSI
jgi:hypothetical protein